MITRDEFNKFLETLVSEEDKKYLATRAKRFKISAIVFYCISVALLIVGVMFVRSYTYRFLGSVTFFGSFFCFVLAIVFHIMVNHGVLDDLGSKYKADVVKYLMNGRKYNYERCGCIDKSIYYMAQLNKNFDRYFGEDFLKINIKSQDGSRSNTHLELSDLEVSRTYTDEQGKTQTDTIYKGVLGYASFTSEFKCTMTINRSSYHISEHSEKVKLESIDFNKKFNIRCTDQIEARYILTPDMMQRLLAIYAKEPNIQIVLDGRAIYITMPKKNLFKLEFRDGKIDGTAFYHFYEDIELLLALVDELQNNKKVFKISE